MLRTLNLIEHLPKWHHTEIKGWSVVREKLCRPLTLYRYSDQEFDSPQLLFNITLKLKHSVVPKLNSQSLLQSYVCTLLW